MLVQFYLFVTFSALSSCKLIHVDSRDGGYKHVVVAISQNVEESSALDLILSIKETLRNTSRYLYDATGQRTWLKEVTIVLPRHWEGIDTEPIGLESFSSADIRIDRADSLYGDGPYTHQTQGCGKPGQYIHVTPQFLLSNSTYERFGDPGRVLVHEWAHLRYGVFDEYGFHGDPMYPPFYLDENGALTSTGCTNRRVTGDRLNYRTNGRCVENPRTGLPEKDCAFSPRIGENDGIVSSLMDLQYLPNVKWFCGHGSSSETTHNKRAPNKHNNLCEGRSVWEVITTSDDYKKWPAKSQNVDPTLTKFRLVQEQQPRYVLVIDNSNKRFDYQRDLMFYIAASKALKNYFPIGSFVGIVAYSSEDNTKIIIDVTELENDAVRQQVAEAVLDVAGSSQERCVRCGIEKAIKALGSRRSGSNIILLTDGNMRSTELEEVKQATKQARVRLFALLYPHPGMRGLDWEGTVKETNGKAYVIDEPRKNKDGSAITVMELEAAFLSILRETLPPDLAPITVVQHVKELSKQIARSDIYKYYSSSSQGSLVTGRFSLDSPSRLIFSLYYYQRGYIDEASTKLYGPSKTYDVSSILRDKYSTMVYFIIDNADNGTWNYEVIGKPPTQQPLIITAAAIPKANQPQPINIRGWMNIEDEVDPAKTPVIIYVELKKGDFPVIGARVKVMLEIVSHNQEQMIQPGPILLRDSGNGDPDITLNDGVYSAYVTHFYNISRYNVRVIADDGGSFSYINTAFDYQRSGANPTRPGEKVCCGSKVPVQQLVPTGPFSREYTIGSFNVIARIQGDQFPPARIGDLQIVEDETNIPSQDGTVITLQWTSPGDDYDYGTASEYELKYSRYRDDLIGGRFNSNADRIRVDSRGRLIEPLEAGTVQKVRLVMPPIDRDVVYYFAIRAKDENANHLAKISNVVQVLVKKTPKRPPPPSSGGGGDPDPLTPTVVIKSGKKQADNDKPSSSSTNLTIIVIVIIVFVVFVALIILLIYALFRRRRKEPRRHNPMLMPDTIPQTKHNNNKAHIVAKLGPNDNDYTTMSPVQSWPASTLLNHYDQVEQAKQLNQPPPIMSADRLNYDDGNSMSTVKHSDSKESIHSSLNSDKDEKIRIDTSPDMTSSTPSLTPSANTSLRRVTQV